MPAKREWTEAEQELLRTMTAQGKSSFECALHFHVSHQYLRRVRAHLGIARPLPVTHVHLRKKMLQQPWPSVPIPQPDWLSREQNWWPLPAGHEVTWSAITAGTCLEGAPYQP